MPCAGTSAMPGRSPRSSATGARRRHGVLPVPHPSWRNTGWLKRNPWFETDLVPALRARVASLLETVAR